MGLFFQKFIDEFETSPSFKVYNKRITISNLNVLKRIDLTFRSTEVYQQVKYPYLENLSALKQLLPVPEFLLKPLRKYNLHYETTNSDIITFNGRKTVIYLHGVGGIAEENSILHRQLLENGCDLIRISYKIDYAKDNIYSPKKAEDMLPFIKEIENKIAPVVTSELKQVISELKENHPDLFENKEIIIIAHSLGGGIIANLVADYQDVKFSKLINLDGTLMNPAISIGLNISQLHLSQDSLFDIKWIDEEKDTNDALESIGRDYCKRINTLISHSTNKCTWIQIKDTTHFSFTDFPNLLKPYKIFKNIAGSRKSSERIRRYVTEFILHSDIIKVDAQDYLIKNM
jgi:predicted esterase